MRKNLLKNVAYFSCWFFAWVLVSSIVNAGFMQVGLYEHGSDLERITFLVAALVTLAGAWSMYQEVLGSDENQTT